MSDAPDAPSLAEAPQSPPVVKKAAGTVPKIRPKPAIPASQPAKPAPKPDADPEPEPEPAEAGNVFGVFGWDL